MAEHREQSQQQRIRERGTLSVEILEGGKKLNQTIKILNAYRRAFLPLIDNPVSREVVAKEGQS